MSYRSGFVGLIGLPNAGKSTLVNALTEEKVSIVTPKPQTTRKRVTGVISKDHFQAVLVDAPGFINADAGLNGFLNQEAQSVVEDVDALVFVISLERDEFQTLKPAIELAAASKKPLLVLLNKADIAKHEYAVKCQNFVEELGVPYQHVSLKLKPKTARDFVGSFLEEKLPETGAPLYDTEIFTTQTEKELCEELIREAAFLKLHQEIPFGIGVKILKFDESAKNIIKIYAEVWVNRESHKGIVVGAKASTLKSIGMESRKRIEEMLGSKVFLDLHVKVKKNWIKNDQFLEELGYVQS